MTTYADISSIREGSTYNVPTQVHWISWKNVGGLLPSTADRIMIVTGQSSRSRAEHLRENLPGKPAVTISPDVPPDPTTESVQELVDIIRGWSPSWIIAIGGGSVLDSGKAGALLARNEGTVSEYVTGGRAIEQQSLPLVAVPTTAGSGSEVTPFSSITDRTLMAKRSISHPSLYPAHAVLDTSLLNSVPPRQAAISGMDALSHAIEGYWSRYSTPVTDSYGLMAARLIVRAMGPAVCDANDSRARDRMMQGSMLAGLTISNAMSTAVHSVSYPLTVFFGVPHGLACGMLLPSFIRYNAGAMAAEKEQTLLCGLGFDSMGDLADAVDDLKSATGLPGRLGDIGLKRSDIDVVVKNGFRPDRVGNNPAELDAPSLTELLTALL